MPNHALYVEHTPRDSQRKLAYQFDDLMKLHLGVPKERLSLKECEDIVRQCLDIWGLDSGYMPRIKDARKNGVTAFGGPNEIILPEWARDKVIVAHESAHCILMRVCGDPEAHGPEWMRVYCLLLARLHDRPESEITNIAAAMGLRVKPRSWRKEFRKASRTTMWAKYNK